MAAGGLREGFVRAINNVGVPRGALDERGIEALRRLRGVEHGDGPPLAEFKAMVREQFYLLLIDQDDALATLPDLLPKDVDARRNAFAAMRQVLSARGEITGEVAERLRRIAGMFGVDPERAPDEKGGPPTLVKIEGTKAS